MKPTGQEKVKPTPTTPFLWFTAATMQQGKVGTAWARFERTDPQELF